MAETKPNGLPNWTAQQNAPRQPQSWPRLLVNPILSYDASPLPAGLSVNTSTGQITGTPGATGVTNVTP
jgi:hypothetical protein